MRRWLVIAAIGGPLLLGAALVTRIVAAGPIWTTIVYSAAGLVCHQRPDRSFWTGGVQWPVCGRCAGLYLAAPLGALGALLVRNGSGRERAATWLAIAAAPTAASWLAEHLAGMPQSNLMRAALAVPLGAAVAYILVRAAPE
jgi:uncharacterized membrane protein